jgi:hypothetical protein
MTDENAFVEIGTILPYVTIYYEPNPPKYKIKFKYWWCYAHTMEEAEKLSAQAKTQK